VREKRAASTAGPAPTPRTLLTAQHLRLAVSCKACGHQADADLQQLMVRAHALACTLSVIPGNRRRGSMAADSSLIASRVGDSDHSPVRLVRLL
jgi:hypothetical protein